MKEDGGFSPNSDSNAVQDANDFPPVKGNFRAATASYSAAVPNEFDFPCVDGNVGSATESPMPLKGLLYAVEDLSTSLGRTESGQQRR